jgi:multiple sugar transport system permease protein
LAATDLQTPEAEAAPVPQGRPRPRPDLVQRHFARLGWGFATPALFVIGALTIFPIVFSLVLSFEKVNVTGSGFSLNGLTASNFHKVFSAPLWHHALWFTTVYTVVTVLVEVVLGTIFALVLERMTRGRGMMMALLLIPWSLITVVSAELWSYIYNATYGIFAEIGSALGAGYWSVLSTPRAATFALMFADIWKTTPFVTIIVLAGLVMIPKELLEASEVDGAGSWKTFWRITVPLLRPTLGIAVLFRVLQAFGLFDLPYVLTGGGPGTSTQSLAMLGYNTMFTDIDFGPGAAIAVSTAFIVLFMCLLFLKAFKQQVGKEIPNA